MLSLMLWPAVLVVVVACCWRVLPTGVTVRLRQGISRALNLYLSVQHSVRNVHDNSELPSVPYEFPNGQGDAAKFLYGRENSQRWEQQHGPIYRIWSGMTPEIVVTKPEHVQDVFKDSDSHLKAKNNNSGYYLGELLGRCVGLVSQNEWKTLRSICEGPFVRSSASSYVPQMVERTQRHFGELWKAGDLTRGIIDPADDLKMLPFWIIADILYGRLTPEMEAGLSELAPQREKLFRFVLQGGATRYSWSRYIPLAATRELAAFKTKWALFNRNARHRARGDEPIARYYQSVSDGTVEEESILQTLDEVLFANLDVTLGGMSWNLVYLASSHDAQSQLRNEIASERAQVGNDRMLDSYIRRSDTFLAACISESSRLRPLAAFSVPQAAPTARIVGGYYFPAGTNFIVDSYALNQRNDYWGKDSATYRPGRFLERGTVKDRYNFWRFGFGPRQCMGKAAADLIIRTLLVHLIENYQLELFDGNKDWERNGEVWINHPVMKLKCRLLASKGGE